MAVMMQKFVRFDTGRADASGHSCPGYFDSNTLLVFLVIHILFWLKQQWLKVCVLHLKTVVAYHITFC